MSTSSNTWHEISPLDGIPKLGSRIVQTQQGIIAVFRASDDHCFAVLNKCPHKGGPLSEGIVHGHSVTCPLHNWVIELESGTAVAPDIGCAPSFPVKVEDGKVFLSLIQSNDCIGFEE